MATTSPIATSITIGGALLGSFGGMIRQSKLGLLSLQTTAIKVNSSISGIGKGLLGLTGSFLAVEGIKGFLTESVKLAKEEAGTHAALVAIITNQNHLRGIGTQQSLRQVEAIERQSKALQEQSGIYKEIFSHGAAQLKVFKLSTAQIQAAQPQIANLMAFQKQMGQDTGGDYEALGKAALTGMTKGLKGIGIEFTQLQSQIFKVMSVSQRWSMIIREIQRQHGGAASARGKTLGGQAELAQIHWKETMETIGESFKPVFQKLTIFFGEIGNIIAPPLIKLSRFISENFDSWVKIVKQSVIPVIRSLVIQGWDYLSKGILWFKNNSKWLLPWIGEAVKLIGLWTFVIGPLIGVLTTVAGGLAAIGLANPFGALVVVSAVAAYAIITHWSDVKKWFMGFYEWIVGTKVFNATLEPEGVKRAFKKGEVPRAQPVQKGFLSWFWKDNINDEDPFNKWLASSWTRFEAWNDKLETAWDNAVIKMFQNAWTSFNTWNDKMETSWDNTCIKWWDNMKNGWKSSIDWMWTQFDNIIGEPMRRFWEWFESHNSYQSGGGDGKSRGSGGGWGTDPGDGKGGLIWNPLGPAPSATVKTGYYGAGVGDRPTKAVTYGPLGHLKYNDIAVAPDLSKAFPLKSYVDLFDKRTGALILAHQRVADSSWVDEKHPNHMMIETWNRKLKQDHVIIKRSSYQEKKDSTSRGHAPVNVTYNVTNHIHGGENLEHRMATLHHRHLEQMKKDLEDATASKHRSAFV